MIPHTYPKITDCGLYLKFYIMRDVFPKGTTGFTRSKKGTELELKLRKVLYPGPE